MKFTRHILILCCGCGLVLAGAGCDSKGGSAGGGGDSGTAAATKDAAGIKHYSPDKLPAVEYNIPPQDEGRLEAPTPTGWKAGSRQGGVILWFSEIKDRSGLPRIVITGVPTKLEGITAVTKANVAEFAKRVAAELEEKEQEVLEPPKALLLGENAWARYVLLGKFKERPVDRQILRTVVDGREYVVELQVNRETVLQHRDSAYALAAGIKFHPAGTAAPESGATPGESKPSLDQPKDKPEDAAK